MKRWEHKVVDKLGAALRDKEEADWLNLMDEEGWKLVTVRPLHSFTGIDLGNRYYFKKQVPE